MFFCALFYLHFFVILAALTFLQLSHVLTYTGSPYTLVLWNLHLYIDLYAKYEHKINIILILIFNL